MKKRTKKILQVVSIIVAVICLSLAVFGYLVYRALHNVDLVSNPIVQQEIVKRVGEENRELVELLPLLLGTQEEKTYLFLFLNNTELRPTGGFIGSYAVANVHNGRISLVTLEGSEQLDRRTPDNWKPVPPRPITEHLGVDRWYFRDSNWDADFRVSAERTLQFYAKEGGVQASEIDYVVAFTTEVIESILELVGPVTVQGKEFTAENVVEVLQYDTSYDFENRGIAFEDRKQILDPLFEAIVAKLPESVIQNYGAYTALANRLIDEKHIQLYSLDADQQKVFELRDIAGVVDSVDHDHLMWVDANLAALKTDHAIDRQLGYTFTKNEEGKYVATASMTYVHNGTFDWRTSRYRTYARVYVPLGSSLVETSGDMRTDRSTDRGVIDTGEAYGYTWFGTFISIEPGRIGTLSFTYELPANIVSQIEDGTYEFLVQKQPGTLSPKLTLDLNFDTNITSAAPAEAASNWGDAAYEVTTELNVDRVFIVNTK